MQGKLLSKKQVQSLLHWLIHEMNLLFNKYHLFGEQKNHENMVFKKREERDWRHDSAALNTLDPASSKHSPRKPWGPSHPSISSCIHSFIHSVNTTVVVQPLSCVSLCDPHRLQHTRLPCPLPSPEACSNSCPSSPWCHPAISSSVLPSPPAFNLSQHQVFANKSALRIRWLKYWSFSFSISSSKVYSGLISFRMDWFYLLAVQGTLKSLLQPHSSKASILWCSAFFIIQLSHHMSTIWLWLLSNLNTDLRFSSISRHVFSPESSQSLISWLYKPRKSSCWEGKWFSQSFTSSKWSWERWFLHGPSPLEKKLSQSKRELPGQIHLQSQSNHT